MLEGQGLRVGGIVISKSGRDKNRQFVVVGMDGSYLYLADGALRKLSKPKKKKFMHVQITQSISLEIAGKLAAGSLKDEDLRKVLVALRKE